MVSDPEGLTPTPYAPPPSRWPRRRRCRGRRRRACRRGLSSAASRVARMRAPEAPIGWPSAQAPPLTLSLSCGMPRSRWRDHGDHGEGLVDLEQVDVGRRSSRPCSSTLDGRHRGGGELGRARGRGRRGRRRGRRSACRASRRRLAARVITRAAAPSVIDEALAAVIVPSLAKAGFSVGILAGSALAGLLVVAITSSRPCGSSPPRGRSRASKAPSRVAALARVRLSVAKASWPRG